MKLKYRFAMLLSLVLIFSSVAVSQEDVVTVISIKANLRGTPDTRGAIVTTVNRGEVFELLATKGAWYLVQTPKYAGWLHGNSIRIGEEETSDYETESLPRRTNSPVSSGNSPFNSEYVGGDKTIIYVTNSANRTLNLTFGGVKYVIPNGGQKTIEAEGGNYEFSATAPGVRSMSGIKQFNKGYRYTWEFYIVTVTR